MECEDNVRTYVNNPGLYCAETEVILVMGLLDGVPVVDHPFDLEGREIGRDGQTGTGIRSVTRPKRRLVARAQLPQRFKTVFALVQLALVLDAVVLREVLVLDDEILNADIVPDYGTAEGLACLAAPDDRRLTLVRDTLRERVSARSAMTHIRGY
jgi:hypothetical protein